MSDSVGCGTAHATRMRGARAQLVQVLPASATTTIPFPFAPTSRLFIAPPPLCRGAEAACIERASAPEQAEACLSEDAPSIFLFVSGALVAAGALFAGKSFAQIAHNRRQRKFISTTIKSVGERLTQLAKALLAPKTLRRLDVLGRNRLGFRQASELRNPSRRASDDDSGTPSA